MMVANRNTPLAGGWRSRPSGLRPFLRILPPQDAPGGVITAPTAYDWHNRALVSMAQADHWAKEWERVKDRIEKTPEYQAATEDVRRRLIEVNYDLVDAAARYSWHANEATRLYTAIIGEAAMCYLLEGTKNEVQENPHP